MFNQILTAFQGFFSRAFWLGSALPVAIVAAAHVALVEIVFPGTIPIREWLAAEAVNTFSGLLLLVFGVVVAAYALAPFVRIVRGVLDGWLLPDVLHDLLRGERMRVRRRIERKQRATFEAIAEFDLLKENGVPRLQRSRKVGTDLGRAADLEAIRAARRAVSRWKRDLTNPKLARTAFRRLSGALKANAADLRPKAAGPSEAEASGRLQGEHDRALKLLQAASLEAKYDYWRAEQRYPTLKLPKSEVTRVGDARQLVERYSYDAYRVGFNYLWPRLQLQLTGDGGFTQQLGDAEARVDASVLLLTLALTIPVVWLPLLIAVGSTPWLFLAIGLVSPFALRFLYEFVVQSQFALGDLIKAAIDHYRIDVLTKTLRQAAPKTLAEERTIWTDLQEASEQGSTVDVAYSQQEPATP